MSGKIAINVCRPTPNHYLIENQRFSFLTKGALILDGEALMCEVGSCRFEVGVVSYFISLISALTEIYLIDHVQQTSLQA